MPNLPDIPGKNIVDEVSRRARTLAGGVGGAAVSAGGKLVGRVLDRGGDTHGADSGGDRARGGDRGAGQDRAAGRSGGPTAPTATPTAPTPPAPPAPPKTKPAPKPKAAPKAKPSVNGGDEAAAKPKTAKAKPSKPSKAKPKAPAKGAKGKAEPKRKSKAATSKTQAGAGAKPQATTGTDAPPKPAVEPGNISGDKEPHHALNNPVVDPDETEYPDPFDKREDPRDPVDPDGAPFGEEPHVPTGAESTSEPPPSQDPEVGDRAEAPKREKLDD
jgi:hypothetical protein